MTLPTAAELKESLQGIPSPPPGMALSVFPFASEHLEDPFWWDQAGRDIIDQRHIFDRHSGEEQVEKLKEVLDEFPHHKIRVLNKAAEEGYAGVIETLLKLGVPAWGKEERKKPDEDEEDEDVQTEDYEFTPLHEAALAGHLDCTRVLVEKGGIDVNQKDYQNATPITYSARKGHHEIVKYLLEQGANPTPEKEEDHPNLLQQALMSGSVDTLKLLLDDGRLKEAGVDVDLSKIEVAASSASIDMIKCVLTYLEFPQEESETWPGENLSEEQRQAIEDAVGRATGKNSLESTRLLLSYLTPPKVDTPGQFQYHAFMNVKNSVATFDASEKIAESDNEPLMELIGDTLLGPPPENATKVNKSPAHSGELNDHHEWLQRHLMYAAAAEALGVVKLILEKYNGNVNHISRKFHGTPLFSAAAQGKLDVVRYLLEQGKADIHIGCGKFANGPTALHNAIRNKNIEVVKALLLHGGPVEELQPEIEAIYTEGTLVVVALESCRAPVLVLSPLQFQEWKKENEEGGRHFSFSEMAIPVNEIGKACVESLQIRKRDEMLKEHGDTARKLMSMNDVDEEASEEKVDRDGQLVKRTERERRGWLERMGLQ